MAFAGAMLAFALQDVDAGPLNLSALGDVLLAAGVILAGGVAVALVRPAEDRNCRGRGSETSIESLRAVTGLVVVITGIVAVGTLTIVAVSLLGVGKENKDATVAIVTSAFGIVSTVVTAFLGIKATANSSQKTVEGLINNLNPPPGDGGG
jgi:hypothetical protein